MSTCGAVVAAQPMEAVRLQFAVFVGTELAPALAELGNLFMSVANARPFPNGRSQMPAKEKLWERSSPVTWLTGSRQAHEVLSRHCRSICFDHL
jgi:hypothetical protein